MQQSTLLKTHMTLSYFKSLAQQGGSLDLEPNQIREAILIRLVEEKFLDLFAQGRMNGTVHTCVGQEFSAVAVAGQLGADDWVTSNHRCHGHFISKTGKWQALIDELMGLKSGACMGIGSSQHLYDQGFLSNGPQAALVPVGLGIALHNKLNGKAGIVTSFIGEGTLGEGAVYESLNMAALYQCPHLIVCENNLYSQSTRQAFGVSGDILDRAKSFGIKTFQGHTWAPKELVGIAKEAIEYVRSGSPAFLLIRTYRLNAHSKGDDNRELEEVDFFKSYDPLSKILSQPEWSKVAKEIDAQIDIHLASSNQAKLAYEDYLKDQLPRSTSARLRTIKNENIRMVQALNNAYRRTLEAGAFHIGEDIEDPYGGAFKVTKGLSTDFPGLVQNSPISECALLGVAIGMSLMGKQSFAEIMFGDFMTHTFDQLISNASKMYHMYGFKISVPVRVRAPMGGKRGYGPTHSQSLEKYFLGIDNIGVLALTSLLDPEAIIGEAKSIDAPLILIENKVDYGRYLWAENADTDIEQECRTFGSLRLRSKYAVPTVTIVSYGESARHIADNLERIFVETDMVPELICLVQLHPLDTRLIEASIKFTKRIVVVEDGSTPFGLGAEVLGKIAERGKMPEWVLRIGADEVPIPSINDLELQLLPTVDKIIHKIKAAR